MRDAVYVERLRFIVGLMSAGRFERGKTSRDLAVEWECHPATLAKLCAEASRVVRASIRPDEVRQAVLEAIAARLGSHERLDRIKDGFGWLMHPEAPGRYVRKKARGG